MFYDKSNLDRQSFDQRVKGKEEEAEEKRIKEEKEV